MTCHHCQRETAYKFGSYKRASRIIQRYRCRTCRKTFADDSGKVLGRHYLSPERATQLLGMMLEGMSIRAISRLTGTDTGTILSLMNDAGEHCARLHDRLVRNIRYQRVQVDEIWGFTRCKMVHVPHWLKGNIRAGGDVWLWTAVDADTKLCISYYVSDREPNSAVDFLIDLAQRVDSRLQLSSDGHTPYKSAVARVFGGEIDYAQQIKTYGKELSNHTRYSPPKCLRVVTINITGTPDPDHVSTSYVERSNLSIRMHMRRYTRLTNAFSKKVENHKAAVNLYMTWYNLCRPHMTLKKTPAMAAGLTDHVWSIAELLAAV